jgi:enoyl-CoA hydratase
VAQLHVASAGGVATVTITNPPRGYMDTATVQELDAVTLTLETDPDVRAVVFTGGVPGVFIRHYSVRELETLSRRLHASGFTVDPAASVPERDIDRVFHRLETMPKPVIAAMNGFAMGGGFEFSLACDIRVTEEGGHLIGLPEVKVGILPGAGGTQRLARLIGSARALEFILRGRTVSPAEALGLGLVHEVAPAGEALSRAQEIATELAGRPAKALAHVKRLVRGARDTSLGEGLALERQLFLDLMLTDEALALMSRMNAEDLDIRDL